MPWQTIIPDILTHVRMRRPVDMQAAKDMTEMTRNYVQTLALVGLLAMASCTNLTREERTVVGLTGGAAAGLITAEALEADGNWRLIAALTGAALGTVVAQNSTNGLCAYSRGDGTYYTARCP